MNKIIIIFLISISIAREYRDIDNLINKSQYDLALKKAISHHIVDPDDPDIHWQLARCYFEVLDQSSDKNVRKENAYKGIEFAKSAIRMNPKESQAHHWYAVLIGQIGILEGTKQKIKNSYKVRKHASYAIELDPKYDGTLHLMGRWHYEIANLSTAERVIASIIYAKPPNGTFEESISFFKDAINAKPDEIRHHLWHAKALLKLKDTENAISSLNNALGLESYDKSGDMLQEEAKSILDDLE
tara:strand:- start:632 stop:1360 length:729 start_codon:yes stop_codon:yes gene_type:complete